MCFSVISSARRAVTRQPVCAAPRRRHRASSIERPFISPRCARLDNIMNVQLDTSRSIRNDSGGRRLIAAAPGYYFVNTTSKIVY